MIDQRIIGTWRLKSTKGVDDHGKVMPPPYGPVPNGVLCVQADGRMYVVLCDGRTELPSGEARQFMSYAGNCTFDGATLTTRVDASSDASRIGGDQVRTVRFENGGVVLAPPPPALCWRNAAPGTALGACGLKGPFHDGRAGAEGNHQGLHV